MKGTVLHNIESEIGLSPIIVKDNIEFKMQ